MSKSLFNKTLLACSLGLAVSAAQADVVSSINPLQFVAAAISDGVTGTQTIVPAGGSPHDYSLKPLDVQKIRQADLVLWIGEDVDGFLQKTIQQVPKDKVINLSQLPEVQKLLLLASAHHHDHGDHHHDHEDHHHDHGDHHHDHEDHHHDHADHHDHGEHHHDHGDHHHDHAHNELETNWHLWFSSQISEIAAEQLAIKLSEVYPQQKAKIASNLAEFKQNLSHTEQAIQTQLAGLKDKGFYVFHDAYTYFNQRYQLNQLGYFTLNPQVAPGAKTLAEIKQAIKQNKVSCLFAEPQFTPKVIETLAKETKVKVGQLDPIGAKIKVSKTAYPEFLQSLADSYAQCLSK